MGDRIVVIGPDGRRNKMQPVHVTAQNLAMVYRIPGEVFLEVTEANGTSELVFADDVSVAELPACSSRRHLVLLVGSCRDTWRVARRPGGSTGLRQALSTSFGRAELRHPPSQHFAARQCARHRR
eukprot:SAG31_NODE_333_length_17527_cov_6.972056_7_plen_125_part_00